MDDKLIQFVATFRISIWRDGMPKAADVIATSIILAEDVDTATEDALLLARAGEVSLRGVTTHWRVVSVA